MYIPNWRKDWHLLQAPFHDVSISPADMELVLFCMHRSFAFFSGVTIYKCIPNIAIVYLFFFWILPLDHTVFLDCDLLSSHSISWYIQLSSILLYESTTIHLSILVSSFFAIMNNVAKNVFWYTSPLGYILESYRLIK